MVKTSTYLKLHTQYVNFHLHLHSLLCHSFQSLFRHRGKGSKLFFLHWNFFLDNKFKRWINRKFYYFSLLFICLFSRNTINFCLKHSTTFKSSVDFTTKQNKKSVVWWDGELDDKDDEYKNRKQKTFLKRKEKEEENCGKYK